MIFKKVKLEAVNTKDEKQVGICVKDNNGNDFWMNAWKDSRTSALNKGETIHIWYFQTTGNTGKVFHNFKLPSVDHLLAMGGKEVTLEDAAEAIGGTVEKKEITVDDIPF